MLFESDKLFLHKFILFLLFAGKLLRSKHKMTSTADSVEDIPTASTMDSSYSIGLTLTSGAPMTVDYGSDYEHAPVHNALPQGEDLASDLQNHFDDSSDDETTACMSSSSDSTVVIPINLDHHQRQFPEKSENGALVAPMHSISMTHLNVNAPPMSFSLDSKSETNSVFYDICKICHQTSDPEDPLISPCRCAGTLQYIHGTCLTVSLSTFNIDYLKTNY